MSIAVLTPLILVVVVALAVGLLKRCAVQAGNADGLGWMSERWLAEHRASRAA